MPFENKHQTVLVTGATGRIGGVVVCDLLERGYCVRATTSKSPPASSDSKLTWRQFDFENDGGYEQLVAGCEAVIHLAADLGQMERMPKVNTRATGLLARAAEAVDVKAFCYVSTVAIYGSGKGRQMHEDGPVLTVERDVPSEYWALPYVRAYGRTKLAGENQLHEVAHTVPYVVLRPSVVVDINQIIEIREWSLVKRALGAHRHAHHIYVGDVSHATIWAIERGLSGDVKPGVVETYNLAEDDYPEPTHAAFLKKAYAVSGDRRFRVPAFPGLGDWLHDFLRFRTLPIRNPLWRMRFPTDRLRKAGYRQRFGLSYAYGAALERLRLERAGATVTRSVDPRSAASEPNAQEAP